MLTREQPDIDVMADGVDMWGLDTRFGYKIVHENMKAWEFISSSLKRERDIDTLNRSKCPGTAWKALFETYTPRTDWASMAVLDEIDCEDSSLPVGDDMDCHSL